MAPSWRVTDRQALSLPTTVRTKKWPLILESPQDGRLAEFKRARGRQWPGLSEISRLFRPPERARRRNQEDARSDAPCGARAGPGTIRAGSVSKKEAKIAADLAISAVAPSRMRKRSAVSSPSPKPTCSTWNTGRSNRRSSAAQRSCPRRTDRRHNRRRRYHRGSDRKGICRLRVRSWRCSTAMSRGSSDVAKVNRRRTRWRLRCDVTDPASVTRAFRAMVEAFGGLDILISNAGAAWQGRIGEVDEAILRESFELNFFGAPARRPGRGAHNVRARYRRLSAVQRLEAGGQSRALISAPTGYPRQQPSSWCANTLSNHGCDGIRANAVNADRIRSGLLTPEFIAERAHARGMQASRSI